MSDLIQPATGDEIDKPPLLVDVNDVLKLLQKYKKNLHATTVGADLSSKTSAAQP